MPEKNLGPRAGRRVKTLCALADVSGDDPAERYALRRGGKNVVFGTGLKFVIGIVRINKETCLPWAKNENYIVCEEHGPVPDKAIKIEKKN